MKLVNKILNLILFLLMLIALIIVSPLLLLIYLNDSVIEGRRKRYYPKFLQSIEGQKFFVHTERQNSKEYIQFTLHPLLPREITVASINGLEYYNDWEKWCFSHMINSISPLTYPVLIKIVKGRILSLKINNEFYNTMHQGKDINVLIEKMKQF